MKKKIIFFVSLLFFCVNFVYAKDVFYFGWDNGESFITGEENSNSIVIKDNNVGFKHGYVTTKIESSNSYMYYYDKNGNEIKKELFESTIFASLRVDGDYLYSVAFVQDTTSTSNSLKVIVMKFNSDLEKIKEIDITDLVAQFDENGNVDNIEFELLLLLPKIIGYDSIGITDDEVAILFSLDDVVVLDKELENAEKLYFSEKKLNKYFPNLGIFIKHINDLMKETETLGNRDFPKEFFLSSFDNEENIISSGIKFNVSNSLDYKNHGLVIPRNYTENGVNLTDYVELDAKITLFDNEYNQIWEVVNNEYLLFFNTCVINNYIVTIGLDVDFEDDYYESFAVPRGTSDPQVEDIHSDILVFDMEGNLIQTIANNTLYFGLNETESGFIVSNIKHIVDQINSTKSDEAPLVRGVYENSSEQFTINSFNLNDYLNDATQAVSTSTLITMTNEVWFINNNIKTNVIGEGSVYVVDTSVAGNDVTFKVEPKEGYVLSVVKVIDQEGNMVTFTDYTFTMPNADVTIEAVFIKNPETIDAVIIFFLIFSISFVVILFSNRKVKFLD